MEPYGPYGHSGTVPLIINDEEKTKTETGKKDGDQENEN